MEVGEGKQIDGENHEKKMFGGGRLSQSELRERSCKGLYFKCGEKWGPEHLCKMKHYQFVLVKDSGGEEEELAREEEEQVDMEVKTLELSLNSKVGLTSNRSFKTWGQIGGREVLVLVDCGATSNFISKKIVGELKLKVSDTPEFVVEVGTGDKVKNRGICKHVDLLVQGVRIQQHFFLME